jgi:2-methylcitrate dehydratase PrpD
MSITKTLSEFSANIQLDRLPPEVVERARYLVLDLVGNMVRARVDAESTPPLFAAAKALGLVVLAPAQAAPMFTGSSR